MENFLFLLVILLLQLIAMKMRIELVTIIISIFGIVLSFIIISEIGYPIFNFLVVFVCLANIYDLAISRPKK